MCWSMVSLWSDREPGWRWRRSRSGSTSGATYEDGDLDADVQTVVDANNLPGPGEPLPSPADALHEHGLSDPLGPHQ
jgi:hypothetical protein